MLRVGLYGCTATQTVPNNLNLLDSETFNVQTTDSDLQGGYLMYYACSIPLALSASRALSWAVQEASLAYFSTLKFEPIQLTPNAL